MRRQGWEGFSLCHTVKGHFEWAVSWNDVRAENESRDLEQKLWNPQAYQSDPAGSGIRRPRSGGGIKATMKVKSLNFHGTGKK